MEALVRNPTTKFGHNFSRRCYAYDYELVSEMGSDDFQHRRNYSRRRKEMKSVSYRRKRARQRQIFLKSYKLASIENLGQSSSTSQKLKKAVVKVKTALVSVVAFVRIHSLSKKLLKQLQFRLKLLKNKRCSIVRLLRDDVAELIKIGREETALNRADQLFQDENIMAVYELLDNFCEFISMNMSYIRKCTDIPNDINEAVSSLVFASSRCGELPELRVIRKLFEERYGQKFTLETAELFPGNLVNFQIKERLSITSVPDYVKHQIVDEIAKDYCLRPELLALEYTSELQQALESNVYQELDKDVYTCNSIAEDCERKTSKESKILDVYVDSSLTSTTATGPNESRPRSHQNSDAVSTSFSSSIVQQSSPDASDSPMIDKAEKVENVAQFDSQFGFKGAGDHTKESQINGRNNIASSSESLPQFHGERLVYLDDIQEFQLSMRKDGDCQDQRLFKFKHCVLPKPQTADGCSESSMGQYELLGGISNSRSLRKSAKASGKQPRRRSLSREILGIKDIECEIYYQKPYKSPANKHRSHQHRKQQKKSAVEESRQSCYANKRLNQACGIELGSNFQTSSSLHCHISCEMSSEHSCYCCIDDDEKETECLPFKLQIGTKNLVGYPIYDLKCENACDHFNHRHSFQYIGSEDTDRASLSHKPRRKSYDNGATEYNVFTYPDRRPNVNANAYDSPRRCAAFNDLFSEEASSLTGKKPKPPYLTVKTMPPERTKESGTDNIPRCSSFPCRYPDHVHPKLPDYDDIAAKFMALKKERLQNKC